MNDRTLFSLVAARYKPKSRVLQSNLFKLNFIQSPVSKAASTRNVRGKSTLKPSTHISVNIGGLQINRLFPDVAVYALCRNGSSNGHREGSFRINPNPHTPKARNYVFWNYQDRPDAILRISPILINYQDRPDAILRISPMLINYQDRPDAILRISPILINS